MKIAPQAGSHRHTITIATIQDNLFTVITAVIGAAVVGLLAFISYQLIGGSLPRLSDTATMFFTRIGGLLLATIGFQMLLGGLKNFFG